MRASSAAALACAALCAAAAAAPQPQPSPQPLYPAAAQDSFLSSVFGSSMVFQAAAPIALWGAAPTGTFVEVLMQPGNVRASGVGDANGRWRAELPAIALPSVGPFTITASTATGALAVLEDVAVGTAIVCSGQSNLSGATTPLSYVFNGSASAAEADLFGPHVRIFAVGEQATQGLLPPQFQLGYAPRQPWARANASNAAAFSGVCWMAAKEIARALGPLHPVGLVESAWSGTCIQAWLPADALASCGPVPPAQGWQTNSTLFYQMIAPFAPQVMGSAADSFSGMTFAGVIW
jgi:sialate O-acetylesterase